MSLMTCCDQGNESRLTCRSFKDLTHIFWVVGCVLSAPFDGAFVFDLADKIKGEESDKAHIFSNMTLSEA